MGLLNDQKWKNGASTGTTIVSPDQLTFQPLGLAVDENQNVYVNEGGFRILKFAPGATKGQVIIDKTSPGASERFSANYIFSDKRGSIYISHFDNPQVTKWSQ
jgi:sugar lactone lactonase YvrE